MFLGYFKDPEKTRSVIDDEGWLHTGIFFEICIINQRGIVKIFDIWLNNLMFSFIFIFRRRYWPVATKRDHEDNRSTTNHFEISSSKRCFK